MSIRRLAIVLSLLAVVAVPAGAAPRAKQPARAATSKPKPKVSQRPMVAVTAPAGNPARSAQIRLASFVSSVQMGQWQRAAAQLSRRVPPGDRRQLLHGPWMRRGGKRAMSEVWYMKEIQIRTVAYTPNKIRLRLVPFRYRKVMGFAHGTEDVIMVREGNAWKLNLRPMREQAQD